MIIMQKRNELPRYRYTLTLLALLLALPAVYPAQDADRFHPAPATPQGRIDDAEPRLGPQPPCGKEPIPPYPDLDGLAVVKSWSRSDLGREPGSQQQAEKVAESKRGLQSHYVGGEYRPRRERCGSA